MGYFDLSWSAQCHIHCLSLSVQVYSKSIGNFALKKGGGGEDENAESKE